MVSRSKIELNNERRHVENVKSIQELELAWEHYQWGERDSYVYEMTLYIPVLYSSLSTQYGFHSELENKIRIPNVNTSISPSDHVRQRTNTHSHP